MVRKYASRVGLVVAIAGLAGVLAAAALGNPGKAGKGGGPMPVSIHADFESYVNFAGTPFCPASSGAILVEGRGVATGPFGKFDSAIGTAAECSAGMFFGAPGYVPAPTLGSCTPPTGDYFDVHGQGVYVTRDGSVLALVYHELSENPFVLGNPPGTPPFDLHDCGIWDVDTAHSTGIFTGATGHGSIGATVPVRVDFSAHVNADYIGSITLGDGVKASHQETHCAGYMTGPVTGDVIVDNDQACILDAAAVNGDVRVHKGASLTMTYSIADGTVDCRQCGGETFFAATVLKNLHIEGASSGATIISSVVGGDLDVLNSAAGAGAFTIATNYSIGGHLKFHENTGTSTIAGNTVARTVACHGNTPAPVLQYTVFGLPSGPLVLTGNTAKDVTGQCKP